jgi:hypothetical protein
MAVARQILRLPANRPKGECLTENAQPRIVKVLSVRDTRVYEETPEGTWKPIPGSGVEHQCDRCGRTHEVHAEVLLDTGKRAIVGTSCMRAESPEIIRQMLSLQRRQRRLAELQRDKARYDAARAAWLRARSIVAAMPVPEVTVTRQGEGGRWEYRCGDGYPCWSHVPPEIDDYEQRRRCAIDAWRDKKMRELGQTPFYYPPEPKCNFEKEIARITRQLAG